MPFPRPISRLRVDAPYIWWTNNQPLRDERIDTFGDVSSWIYGKRIRQFSEFHLNGRNRLSFTIWSYWWNQVFVQLVLKTNGWSNFPKHHPVKLSGNPSLNTIVINWNHQAPQRVVNMKTSNVEPIKLIYLMYPYVAWLFAWNSSRANGKLRKKRNSRFKPGFDCFESWSFRTRAAINSMFVQRFVHGPQSWATEERQVLEVEPGLNPPNFLHTLKKCGASILHFLGDV